jgi:hypothetical protein
MRVQLMENYFVSDMMKKAAVAKQDAEISIST